MKHSPTWTWQIGDQKIGKPFQDTCCIRQKINSQTIKSTHSTSLSSDCGPLWVYTKLFITNFFHRPYLRRRNRDVSETGSGCVFRREVPTQLGPLDSASLREWKMNNPESNPPSSEPFRVKFHWECSPFWNSPSISKPFLDTKLGYSSGASDRRKASYYTGKHDTKQRNASDGIRTQDRSLRAAKTNPLNFATNGIQI